MLSLRITPLLSIRSRRNKIPSITPTPVPCLPSSRFPIVDLTEDTADDMAPAGFFQSYFDLTEDSDDDMAPVDLSEYIDDDTLNTVQYNANKDLKAKAKRDDAKAPTKNEIRVKKNADSKRSYHSMDKQIIDKLNTKNRTKQREVRAELDKKPSAKQISFDRRNHRGQSAWHLRTLQLCIMLCIPAMWTGWQRPNGRRMERW